MSEYGHGFLLPFVQLQYEIDGIPHEFRLPLQRSAVKGAEFFVEIHGEKVEMEFVIHIVVQSLP